MTEEKPLILAIVGPSGSGKTEMANYIRDQHGIYMIESYTDRPPRVPNESGHVFVTPQDFDEVMKKPMIAYTQFGEHRYCCLEEDVHQENTYVIDENGLEMLLQGYGDTYDIHSVFVERRLEERKKVVDIERIARDKGRFLFGYDFYDDVIFNVSTLEDFHKKITQVVDSTLAKYGRL